jgi:hypothetical protein
MKYPRSTTSKWGGAAAEWDRDAAAATPDICQDPKAKPAATVKKYLISG